MTTRAIASAVAVLLAAGPMLFVRNRVIRRRLLFSLVAIGVAGVLYAGTALVSEGWLAGPNGHRVVGLLLAIAVANSVISLAFNPWFRDGESDRAPSIVQDSLVIAAGLASAAFLFQVSSFNFLTGSAIVAAVVGFALQDTLGNAFAGIALQIERPFRVGHWISVGEWVGLVTEVTWRATKIRTKAGNVVAVPNSVMSGQAITNYSEPVAPTRMQVEVGASYGVPPNDVRRGLLAAARAADHVLSQPAPEALVIDFGASAVTYRVRFWVSDFSRDETAKDAVRTRIFYEFRRRGIEIPWPIQVQYERHEPVADVERACDSYSRSIAGIPVFASLPPDAHRALARSTRQMLFADAEPIVLEGADGGSMFVVMDGSVAVTVGSDRRQVAVIDAPGYFGEMSLLTGEPRTATVLARGDCTVLEIAAEAFRAWVQARPDVIDELALAAGARRRELDDARVAASGAQAVTGTSLQARMRKFFGLT